MTGYVRPGIGAKADKADKATRRRLQRSCGNPPAAPTGVVQTFKATEALVHLRFTAKVRWNEVTEDSQGHPTPIRRYEVQMQATDAGGDPVETEDGKVRLRMVARPEPTKFPVFEALIVSGTTARFNCSYVHNFAVGDEVRVAGITPSAYNGTWTVVSVPTFNEFLADIGASPADATDFGHAFEEQDVPTHVISEVLARPKTWYWKSRVRAIDRRGCAGNWSSWTAPALPWTGADPVPPTPTYGGSPITFDSKGKGPGSKVRLKFTFDEVVNFDYPGTPADDEDDVAGYVVQLDRSDDGITWDGPPYRTHHRAAKDGDADTTVTAIFEGIRRRYWYRCRLRCVDRFGRRSAWSSFTAGFLPFDDDAPPQPELVKVFAASKDRISVRWDDPVVDIETRGTVSGTSGSANLTGAGTKFTREIEAGSKIKVQGNVYKVKKVTTDTALVLTTNLSTSPSGAKCFLVEPDPDVAFYHVQIAKSADVDTGTTPDEWSDFYAGDRARSARKDFKVDDADSAATFYARVRSVDAAYNRSKWVPATLAGNSDPNANGDGVTVGADLGGVVATFTKIGRLRLKHYANRRWTNPTGRRMYFLKARATVGDTEALTGAPTGSAIKMNLKRWNAAETSQDNVFQVGGGGADDDRLIINAGTYKDANGPSAFEIAYLDPDEALSLKVAQVGSSFAGEDLTVQVYMEP